MIKMHYRGVHVSIIVYDVTDKSSFKALEDWFLDITTKQQGRNLSKDHECIYFIVANKADLSEKR